MACNASLRTQKAVAKPLFCAKTASNNCVEPYVYATKKEAQRSTQITPLEADPAAFLIPSDADKHARYRLDAFVD